MFFKKKKRLVRNYYGCPMKWEDMKGTKNVRFCEGCESKVYDLNGLTEEEIIQFIELENGELCGKAHFNKAGRVVNGECAKATLQTMGRIGAFTEEEILNKKIEEAQKRVENLLALKELKEGTEENDQE